MELVRFENGKVTRMRDGYMELETRFKMYAQLFLQNPGACWVMNIHTDIMLSLIHI